MEIQLNGIKFKFFVSKIQIFLNFEDRYFLNHIFKNSFQKKNVLKFNEN